MTDDSDDSITPIYTQCISFNSNNNRLNTTNDYLNIKPKNIRYKIELLDYDPKSIKNDILNGKLIVTGHRKYDIDDDDYTISIFKKSFKLPTNVDLTNLTSKIINNYYIIEIPLKTTTRTTTSLKQELQKEEEEEEENDNNDDDNDDYNLLPRIIKTKDGLIKFKLKCELPKKTDMNKINVKIVDDYLIIKLINNINYAKRIKLPSIVNIDDLRCFFKNDILLFESSVYQD